jgi:hypothetical protein
MSAIEKLAASPDGKMAFLGGQNPFGYFHEAGQSLNLDGIITPYTEDLAMEFSFVMYDYIEGDRTYEECLADFYAYAEEAYGLRLEDVLAAE